MIKAIIYDMDDLMIDSDRLHVAAWEKVLHEYGHRFSDIPETARSGFIGMRVKDICKALLRMLDIDEKLDIFYRKRIGYLMAAARDVEAMPGLVESLELFKNNNLKIALASSGNRQYISIVLDKFDIRSYFDEIISGDDVKLGKPDPETYQVAAKRLGIRPQDCLVLEDAYNGIISAKAAGCLCIAVINPNTPPQDVSQADIVLSSLIELDMENISRL